MADYSYYGVPCRALITADSLYLDQPHDVPPLVEGKVLMSAGVLSGFEFGPGSLNPYEGFKVLKPIAAIDDAVFLYEGQFAIPLAAALSHTKKAGVLLRSSDLSGALAEARQAEALAPDSAIVNNTLARVLDVEGKSSDAVTYYQKALSIAQKTEPKFQAGLIASITKRLSTEAGK